MSSQSLHSEEDVVELIKIGDQMQSALSRVATYLLNKAEKEEKLAIAIGKQPLEIWAQEYEVHMAATEGQSSVEKWTEIRRRANR